jgi:hypothetical protein
MVPVMVVRLAVSDGGLVTKRTTSVLHRVHIIGDVLDGQQGSTNHDPQLDLEDSTGNSGAQ